MPIEFRCTQCNKLLRTGDDTAGKQAKCPECGAVMPIPAPEQGPWTPHPPMGSPPPAESPFGQAAAPAPPDSMNPYQSPAGLGPEPLAFAPPGEIRPTRIDFSDTLSRTWTVFTERWLSVLGALALLFIINIVVSLVVQGMITAVGTAVNDASVAAALTFFFQIALQIFAIWLGIGLQLFTLGVVRGEQPSLGLLFAGGRYLLPILLCMVLTAIIVLLGFLLLIIPGIIFAMMLMQAQLLIIDRNMGVIDALSTSREVMAGNKLTVFGIGLVAGVLGILVVLLTCGLGYLAVGPYFLILAMMIYLGVTGQPTAADRYALPSQPTGAAPLPQPPQTPFGPSSPGSTRGDSWNP